VSTPQSTPRDAKSDAPGAGGTLDAIRTAA